MTLAANQIDRALRRGQDDQTIGIPIGPSWSLALSELITSQIDERLQNEFPNARGVRLLDDYEIGAESEAEAERILAFLRSALADYELQLNTSKTSVTPAPLPLVPSWISDLRAFRIRGSERTQSDDILRYFDLAASLGESTATATPMTWFARRLRWMSIRGRNWPLVHDLLLQAMVIEPGSIRHAMGALLHHSRSGFPVDREGLQRTLTRLIVRHAPQGSGSEVAWSLWSAIAFDVALGEEVGQAVSGLPDAVVALLAMDAANRGLLLGLDTTAWLALLTTEELRAEHWLLAYEAPLKGWLGDRTHFAGAPEFEWLSSQAVSFYDSDEPLRRSNEMTAPKPPDKGEQGKSSEQIQPTPFVLDLFDIPVTIESGDNGDEEPYP